MGEYGLWFLLAMGLLGVIVGYHLGLRRANESFVEAMGGDPAARAAAIEECIKTVAAIRPNLADAMPIDATGFDEYERMKWRRFGVDEALEALRAMDKRGAGRIPRNIFELRRMAD